ncbi:MAG: tetratricopeptide repeat protein, partial [Casimicrobiaceae bacterium]
MTEPSIYGTHPKPYLQALDLYRLGRLRDTLQACVAHLGSSAAPYPPTLALLGRVLADAGHYREAALELARALALDPRDAATWLTLAQVHIQLNDPGTA